MTEPLSREEREAWVETVATLRATVQQAEARAERLRAAVALAASAFESGEDAGPSMRAALRADDEARGRP